MSERWSQIRGDEGGVFKKKTLVEKCGWRKTKGMFLTVENVSLEKKAHPLLSISYHSFDLCCYVTRKWCRKEGLKFEGMEAGYLKKKKLGRKMWFVKYKRKVSHG